MHAFEVTPGEPEFSIPHGSIGVAIPPDKDRLLSRNDFS
jgi:hypothetical protein